MTKLRGWILAAVLILLWAAVPDGPADEMSLRLATLREERASREWVPMELPDTRMEGMDR